MSPSPSQAASGRRVAPRVLLDGELVAYHSSQPQPLVVLDASVSGLSLRSPVTFAPGSGVIFRLASVDGRQTTALVRVRHCEVTNRVAGEDCFHVGVEFVSPTQQTRTLVESIISRAAATTPVAAPGFSDLPAASGTGDRVVSRRRTPRFEVTGNLGVTIDRGTIATTLRDIGFGGFAVESQTAFRPGTRYSVRFTASDAFEVTLQADAVHSRPADGGDGRRRWITGFQFVAESSGASSDIARVIDRAIACLEFL